MNTQWIYLVFFRMRKEWKSILIWLLLPLAATVAGAKMMDVWSEQSKVPVGLAAEEQTAPVQRLIEELEKVSLLDVRLLNKREALRLLEQHELDSVFVIRRGYEEKITSGERNQVIEAYSSNRSFAYNAVVETVTSLAQQDASRAKAAFAVKRIFDQYNMIDQWHYDKIIETSKVREQNEALIQTEFSFDGKRDLKKNGGSVNANLITAVWSFFSVLSTFFLFDWVVKEKSPAMRNRWLFAQIPFQTYALSLLVVYTVLITAVNTAGVLIINSTYHWNAALFSMLAFQIAISLLAFLCAILFRQNVSYYITGLACSIVLLAAGGVLLPAGGIFASQQWLGMLNPVYTLANNSIPWTWLIVTGSLTVLWWRGGRTVASS